MACVTKRDRNVAIGYSSAYDTTGSKNTAVGTASLFIMSQVTTTQRKENHH